MIDISDSAILDVDVLPMSIPANSPRPERLLAGLGSSLPELYIYTSSALGSTTMPDIKLKADGGGSEAFGFS